MLNKNILKSIVILFNKITLLCIVMYGYSYIFPKISSIIMLFFLQYDIYFICKFSKTLINT